MSEYIEVSNVTKNYDEGRGIFDISFKVKKGETFGIVGINGAGKTTLLRHLMGFIKANSGQCTINGLDCWADSAKVKELVAYIPGEIAFPPLPTGDAFLEVQAEFWGQTDLTKIKELTQKLQLATDANLKRMSKGMKQKTAIAASFLPDSDILIFDEPTTGLDPLMRTVFMDVIEEQRQRGKTIIMSSHMFEELEDCCDRIIMIKEGKIVATVDMDDVRHNKDKTYKIEFLTAEDFTKFRKEKVEFNSVKEKYHQVFVKVHDEDINGFFKLIANYSVKFISEIKYTLEEHFLKIYKTEGEQNNGNK